MELRNTSRWPSVFIRHLMRWLCKTLDHPTPKTLGVVVRDSAKQHVTGHAWGRHRITASARRHGIRRQWLERDSRFHYAAEYPLRSDLEAFVFLMAHELRHLNPDNSRGLTRQGYEQDANHAAGKAIEAFRSGGWREIRAAMLAEVRGERAKTRAAEQRHAAKVAERKSPEYRLANVQAKRARLERKVKALLSRIARHKRSERALERSIARKASTPETTPATPAKTAHKQRAGAAGDRFRLTPEQADAIAERLGEPASIAEALESEPEHTEEHVRWLAGYIRQRRLPQPEVVYGIRRDVLVEAVEGNIELAGTPRGERLLDRIARLYPLATQGAARE